MNISFLNRKMPFFAKVLLKQLKTRIFVLFKFIKQLLCCFRNKADAKCTNEHVEKIIVDNNFVIVQQNEQPLKNTAMTTLYDQETLLNEWDAMAPVSNYLTQQNSNSIKCNF